MICHHGAFSCRVVGDDISRPPSTRLNLETFMHSILKYRWQATFEHARPPSPPPPTTSPTLHIPSSPPGSNTGIYLRQYRVIMVLCSHAACDKMPHFHFEGVTPPAYCKQHSEIGMVNVRSKRCQHPTRTTTPSRNVIESKKRAYCKKYAENGMANTHPRRCSHHLCPTLAFFNTEGNSRPAYNRQHAGDGIVHTGSVRSSMVPARTWLITFQRVFRRRRSAGIMPGTEWSFFMKGAAQSARV